MNHSRMGAGGSGGGMAATSLLKKKLVWPVVEDMVIIVLD